MSNKLTLISFVKNEINLIKSFLDYHVKIFDEIYIIDDGSTDGTIDIIKAYKSVILKQVNNGFTYKGGICSDVIRTMNTDLVIPMDADEKMIYDDNDHEIKNINPKIIKEYLQNLPITGYKYKVKKVYEYYPLDVDWYGINTHPKIFFPRKTFLYTDPGFHRGRVSLDTSENFNDLYFWRIKDEDTTIPTNISYIHYHFLTEQTWLKNTEKKLEQRIGCNWRDPETLKNYNGPSLHLKEQYINYINTGVWHNVSKSTRIELHDSLDEHQPN